MNILDCTLRDGGYYNNWDFEPEVVSAYLDAVAEAKIEFVELGLRNFPKSGFLGAYAYTTEAHINSLDLPKGPTYGVMVDAKTILESGFSVEVAVKKLFVPASESKIDLVRIAAHFHEVENSGPIVKQLKALGYIVGYNLMQAGGKPDDVIADKARQATEWGGLDALYFADSLGNMDGAEVTRIVNALRTEWNGPLGIHTHDNMGKGLDNTLTAKSLGVTWLDTTITGMGRGAGNTQTESLLAVLDKEGSVYNAKPIYELVIRHFEPMQKKYGWGSNLLYFLGAQYDVHPTYIQNLLSNTHYGTDEIVGAIDYLSKLESTTSYNGAILNTALSFNESTAEVSGSEATIGVFNNKNVLLVANGPSTQKYLTAIKLYIEQFKPVVISININESLPTDMIDYYVISHNSKFLADAQRYQALNKPVILPVHRFTKDELALMDNLELIDYGLEVKTGKLASNKTYAVVPSDITTAYVLAMLMESQPKSVKSVGFDGYDKNDPRQQEMINILDLYTKNESAVEVVSLTPTTYPLVKGSVYAPDC
ncbi:aldolase catalytic domain-containing protein [Pseudoalteromonas sp. 2CM41L]|uniref:aldolase catalytic domain-containing protein n=1 Tax=Pseudoalteromonas sp. 2CM41L TaxID=2929857 RepID=UPI0020BEB2E8|nr:aldolase catalytic domain-containing protein [Pseudoalteromonas sp. 2CM41L]MCK8107689.1 aldolase catalytic domain-containing protein [Pseudoalteromonas sp. 2CM41L]